MALPLLTSGFASGESGTPCGVAMAASASSTTATSCDMLTMANASSRELCRTRKVKALTITT